MSRVLCVDDNDNNLYLLTTMFERAGFEVIVARSGEEGVTLAATSAPDVVIMDLTLPGIDGCEATRQIRAAPATQDVPIIALTGHDEEEKGAAVRAAGCTGYARKPVQIRALLTLVNELMETSAKAPSVALEGGVSP
jgi:CheY-like chemotaxis protein